MLGHRPIATAPLGSAGGVELPTIIAIGALLSDHPALAANVVVLTSVSGSLLSAQPSISGAGSLLISASGVMISSVGEVTGSVRSNIARFTADLTSSAALVSGYSPVGLAMMPSFPSGPASAAGVVSTTIQVSGDLTTGHPTINDTLHVNFNANGALQMQHPTTSSTTNVKINASGGLLMGPITLDVTALVVLRRLAAWGVITRIDAERED